MTDYDVSLWIEEGHRVDWLDEFDLPNKLLPAIPYLDKSFLVSRHEEPCALQCVTASDGHLMFIALVDLDLFQSASDASCPGIIAFCLWAPEKDLRITSFDKLFSFLARLLLASFNGFVLALLVSFCWISSFEAHQQLISF